jgi:hypothetical protein
VVRGRLPRGWARACARSVRAVCGAADTGWACVLLGCDRRRVRSGRTWNEMCDGGGHRSQADAAKTCITTAVVRHPALAGAANGHRAKRGRGECEGQRASLVVKPCSRCRAQESLEKEGTRVARAGMEGRCRADLLDGLCRRRPGGVGGSRRQLLGRLMLSRGLAATHLRQERAWRLSRVGRVRVETLFFVRKLPSSARQTGGRAARGRSAEGCGGPRGWALRPSSLAQAAERRGAASRRACRRSA